MNTNIKFQLMNEYEHIITAIPEDRMIKDNHNYGTSKTKIAGVGFMSDGSIVGLFDSRYFSLNELYISKASGEVHLSTCSVAGVVKPMETDMNLAKAIEVYNTKASRANFEYGFDNATIEHYHIF